MALPIEDILPQVRTALRDGTALVVQAPPGAGKSTLLPLSLLDEAWLDGRKIVMLEPRRLAARLVAKRLAENLGDPLGNIVGYRMRDDSKTSRATRLEVVTEGILTRMLHDDPELPGIGALLFDEFHERSLPADLGLALAIDVQRNLRPDLRLVAMSATLDGEAVAKLLGGAPIVTSDGRIFPVETRYLPVAANATTESTAAQAARQALRDDQGDVLVFLPGVREIGRVERLLAESGVPGDVNVMPLYGELPPEAQDRAVAANRSTRRRVVLSTAIAETSLTIEGVRVVIVAGLSRRAAFDAPSGMGRLVTLRASLASADQRRGRAGRTAPGVCYRLWPEAENKALPRAERPEIEVADLAPLALDLALWGASDTASLHWMTPPPAPSFAQAQELLRELDALDAGNRITAHGRKLAALPVHPRLAHMIVKGGELGLGVTACRIAALLEDRDVLRAERGRRQADLRLRLEALQGGRVHRDLRLNEPAARRALRLAERWRKQMRFAEGDDDLTQAGLLLAFAYPDRIARRRSGGEPRYVMSNGRGAALDVADGLAGESFIAVAELDGAGAEGAIYLAAPLDLRDIEEHFASHIFERDLVEWDERNSAVLARRQRVLGSLVLEDAALKSPPAERVAQALLDALRKRGIEALSLSAPAQVFRQRVMAVRGVLGEAWPDLSDAGLLASLEQWLAPHMAGVTSLAKLRALDLEEAIAGLLDWQQRRDLDRLAPTHIEVPSGSRIRIDYSNPAKPVLAVKLQEMFGSPATPRIVDGRLPLTLHLLSPAGRPLQVTGDLAGFWAGSYGEVRRDMRGRYPRHPWPDDPLAALPTARAKRRGT
jgi:ATP-dependent helicase HrpB